MSYGSWLTPDTVLDYDPRTNERHVRKQKPILGGYDPADYVQTREWVTARDGAQIPISIVHHKDVEPRSDARRCCCTATGPTRSPTTRSSASPRLSLLDRGMVFVLAHIRGGGEMGRLWYEHGKLLEKKNTFTDYVDCAQHLIDTGWTDAGLDGRPRRQRRRAADGRGRQPRARAVRRHRGPGAVRRCARPASSTRTCR